MIIRAIVEFEITEEDADFIDPDKIVGESVSIKSGEYENLIWGTVISTKIERITMTGKEFKNLLE